MTGTPASAGQRGGTPTSFGAEPAQTPWTCLHQLPGLRPPRREGATAGVGRCLLFGVGGRRLFCQLGSAFVLLAASFGFVPSSVGLGSSWRPSVHPDRPPAGCVWAAAVPICPLRAASHNKAFCWLLDAAPICLFALGSPGCMGPVTCVPPGTQGQKGKPDPMGLQMGWGGGVVLPSRSGSFLKPDWSASQAQSGGPTPRTTWPSVLGPRTHQVFVCPQGEGSHWPSWAQVSTHCPINYDWVHSSPAPSPLYRQ